MPASNIKRAWIVVSALVGVSALGIGTYLYRQHRPLSGPSAGTAPAIMSLLPPGAPVVGYIDVAALRKLQGSPLAAVLGLVAADPKEDRDYQEFVRDTGFDYARDLDTVAIAIWPSAALGPIGVLGGSQVEAIADGRFDQDKIKAYALRSGEELTQGPGMQSFYLVRGDPPVSVAFLSATRLVLANGRGLSLLVPMPSTAEKDAMQARINRVAGAPIFAAARTDTLPKSFYDNFKNAPQLEALARTVTGLTLAGQPQGDRIDMALDGECDSLTHAAEVATFIDTLRLFGTVALSDPKMRRQMSNEQAAFLAALVSQVKVTHQDRWVRLTLTVTPEMLGPSNSNRAELR
jgi:hypothetical protein